MEDMNKLLGEVKQSLGRLGRDYPDVMKAFSSFMGEVEEPGALDAKTKELIAVSLSVACKCKWCIAFHVKNALDAGASRNEIMESCFVAALMAGGPALMYMQLVVKAIDDFGGKE
jgi:AhpD family alkylhydroperoxidase